MDDESSMNPYAETKPRPPVHDREDTFARSPQSNIHHSNDVSENHDETFASPRGTAHAATPHLATSFAESNLDPGLSLEQPFTNNSNQERPSSPLFEPMEGGREDRDSESFLSSAPSTRASPALQVDLDGLKRARAMKAEIESNAAVLKHKANNKRSPITRKRVEDDPENLLIKRLRQDERMNWTDIVNHLNDERRKNGLPPDFTQPAVYSRFVRNAPRIAAAMGEVGFDPKDYMHLRNPHGDEGRPARLNFDGVPKKRIRNPNDAKELSGNMRQKASSEEQYAELETVAKTEALMNAVAVVERNFWIFVADELERKTTKLYDPKLIESRYHAI